MNYLYKALCIIAFHFLTGNPGYSQCGKEMNPFKAGEKITYQAYYNWGFIWIHAADVEFSVKAATYQSGPVFQLSAIGVSRKSYDWIYKVRDTFQTYVDQETFQPYWFERKTLEGGYKVYENYIFNPSQSRIYSATENSDRPFSNDTLVVKPCTLDVLTAVYTCRSLNFNDLKINQKFPISMVIDNKVYPLYIRYLGKENIETKNKQKFKCIKFSVLLVEGTIFKGGEDMFIWVTDDENRVPVLVEAKILIGSVKAYLNTTSGLTGDLKALIK
jgi:hypothetical protein